MVILAFMYPIPELNNKQLDRLSEYLSNFSILLVATLILPNMFGLGNPNVVELKKGIILSVGLLILSLAIIKRTK